jgi:hypothetical protein
MCFKINKNYPKALTAEHDIECYKVMKIPYVSYFESLRYKLNTLYNETIQIVYQNDEDIDGDTKGYIEDGFHSYAHRFNANEFIENFVQNKKIFVDIVVCIIPKGAKYYYNPIDEEYVSNQIIIKGI